MRTLVTGANGFLGSNVVRALAAAGHEVRALVRNPDATARLAGLAVERCVGDVRDAGSLETAMAGVDVVLHLAARVADWGAWHEFFEVNVRGTEMVLDAARRARVRRVVLLSSLAVHRLVGHRGATEATPRDHLSNPYAASKIQAENAVRHAHERGDVEGVVIRPGMLILGPGDALTLPGLAPLLRAGIVPVIARGEARTCFSYSENLAEGLVLAAQHPQAAGDTFVMEDGVCVSWRNVFLELGRALARTEPVLVSIPVPVARAVAAASEAWAGMRGHTEPPTITRYRVDLMAADSHFVSDRARALLGYAPRIGYHEALGRAAAAYLAS